VVVVLVAAIRTHSYEALDLHQGGGDDDVLTCHTILTGTAFVFLSGYPDAFGAISHLGVFCFAGME